MDNILPSLHLYISNCIHVVDSMYIVQIDMNKTSPHCIKNISQYDTNVSKGFIRCFITNMKKLNLNNVEVMTTLEFKPNYNNFIMKNITVINKNEKKNYSKNYYQSLNKNIFQNVKSIKLV